MLEVTAADDVEELADHLAGVLGAPLPDPLAPEWIVVATAGARRWLRLALARRLGVAGPGAADGVAANLDLLFPQALTRRVLHPDAERTPDPWDLDRLVWAVLDVLATGDGDALGPAARLAPGATRWGQARRLADLLDRYLLHRPGMVRAWARGRDDDALGQPLAPAAAWQAHLFRRVAERIGTPSPAEQLPERLADLRAGAVPPGIPDRVCLFGLSTVPGGAPFLDVLDALAAHRQVHLLVHQPSPGLVPRVRRAMAGHVAPDQDVGDHLLWRREQDPTSEAAHHPLVRSWARPAREAAVLLGDRLAAPAAGGATGAPTPGTLLARLQADVRADAAPGGDLCPDPDDRSVVVHACHGPTRQVEVLRDQVLHLLADDPTLSEDDVVVLCPDLTTFAPLLEAVLGPPALADHDGPGAGPAHDGPPALAYRVVDRSLGATYPLLRSLGALVELLASRCSDAGVLDLANLGPVRTRFGFGDADLEVLAGWVEAANTRWGLDADHRRAWGLPPGHDDGTWRTTLDRLLVGVAVSDDPVALGPGGVLPVGVEGGDVALAGRFADLVGRIHDLHHEVATPRPARAWVHLLAGAADDLFAVAPDQAWQQARLRAVLEDVAEAATLPDGPSTVDLALDDVRHLLGRHLQGPAGRAAYFRGGVTVSSLRPLQGLPHRVVCLLGMDEGAWSSGMPDGDDLTAADPLVGDGDRRAEARQGLLETVQATGEQLVVLRSGHDVVTNQPVPPAVVVAELVDALVATVAPEQRAEVRARLEVEHPRQRFDERAFLPAPGHDRPWSFDPLACRGAAARARRAAVGAGAVPAAPSLLVGTAGEVGAGAEVVDLADLRDLLHHAPRHFLRQRLDLRLPDRPERLEGRLARPAPGASGLPRAADGRDLVLALNALERWKVRDRYLQHRRGGGATEDFLRRERAGDGLPPGLLADAVLTDATDLVDGLLARVDELGALGVAEQAVPIDVALPDGTRVVGTVTDAGGHRPGPLRISASAPGDRQRPVPWLEVLALTAHDPDRDWAAVLLHPPRSRKQAVDERVLAVAGADAEARRATALEALALVVDLERRSRRQALPLFPRLSPALHHQQALRGTWTTPRIPGDGDDPWVQVAFGHPSLEAITSLPVLPDDPPGPGHDRARRYAHHLWGAIDASTAVDDGDGGGR